MRKQIPDTGVLLLQEQSNTITEYDESLIRRLIEKVAVYEDKFTMEFKFGVTIDVEE
jgi:site-specific DNA recombinase